MLDPFSLAELWVPLVLVGALTRPANGRFVLTSLTVTLDLTILQHSSWDMGSHGHGIVPHGELVLVVSLLPVMPLIVCM